MRTMRGMGFMVAAMMVLGIGAARAVVPPLPEILEEPGDTNVLVGESATFSVVATNAYPALNYQWKRTKGYEGS